ncbi:hypothetical protein TNCT_125781 [Trichonephila clavata]|uniref:Uncharacterized protein n=1 Tax=Trichonephila clavata TaxID=2740835 RepID=A0A8X6GL93_TRICU|nr:hypothetical protein TNCT_125781 [Trichonephila clavata]
MLATQRSVDSSATELTNVSTFRNTNNTLEEKRLFKGFATVLGEDTHRKYYYFGFFIPLELEQREREKAEHCVCVKRDPVFLFRGELLGSFSIPRRTFWNVL